MIKDLTPQNALIFRIVHRDNVPWILRNGLHCRSSRAVDPNFVQIGNLDLIAARQRHPFSNGTLSDYIPFYFTPFSPMFYSIFTGYKGIQKRSNEEIVILESSLHILQKQGVDFVFTDRHAYLKAAQCLKDLARLDQIDWSILQRRDLQRDPEDPGKVERYEAEALVHKHLPVGALRSIICYADSVAWPLAAEVKKLGLKVPLTTNRDWYF